MKRSDYRKIASYDELQRAQCENCKAIKELKKDFSLHGTLFFESLMPKALLGCFMHYLSPLISLYRQFCK